MSARAATSTKGTAVKKVAFTMVPVRDAQRARTWYEEMLGLSRGSHSQDGVWTEYDLPGGGCLALFGNADMIAPSADAGSRVALEVEDLDALIARLESEGVKFQGDMVHSPVCRMSFILDSEGNSIILHELNKNKKS